MDRFETKAYEWLISQGYKKDDIIFRFRGTPDFVTNDGKGWEVKTLRHNTTDNLSFIVFTGSQIYTLKECVNLSILVFQYFDKYDYRHDVLNTKPFMIIQSNQVKDNKIINGILIRYYNIPKKIKLLIERDVMDNLLEVKKDDENYSELISRLIRNDSLFK